MKRGLILSLVVAFAAVSLVSVNISYAQAKTGKALFEKFCGGCHPNGGNTIKPEKTLSKKDRDANSVKTTDDIVKLMRNPVPPMMQFDKANVSDSDAKKIAEYILKTFK